MCGIVGIVYKDPGRAATRETVVAMSDLIAYRGPDEAGVMLEGPVGLGHRRLSIIDLATGQQPMADALGQHHLVFNGEIYNYRELREQLTRRGHNFRTNSDTEVILALYRASGPRCVEEMNGMFAFAIWDSAERRLFLARDRMGEKPLYYADTGGAFAFGSEAKALFASGVVSARLRHEAVGEYLTFRQVAGPDGFFTGVKSLPPGCTLTLEAGVPAITRYWSPRGVTPRPRLTRAEALEELSALLQDSVRMRMVSDVPLGTFCSGGVDSSLVTALAAKLGEGPINTFSIGFDDPAFDESAQALQVSRHCGTTHHRLTVGNDEFDELFPQMVWQNDEPLDFANSVHIFALSRLAKNSVTVVLTGEGSDELFGGYPRYQLPDLVQLCRFVPRSLRHLVGRMSGDHRLAKLSRFADCTPEDVLYYNSSYSTPADVSALSRETVADVRYRRECLDASRRLRLERFGRVSLLDQETFLVGILNRQDKMSMAASIESRVPFMDHRIVEFANSLPRSLKVSQGSGKVLVKALARTLLPAEIVDRRKSGFGVPLASWFRADTGLGARLLALPTSPSADLFETGVLTRLIREHRAETHDHSELLWSALNLATWRDKFRC